MSKQRYEVTGKINTPVDVLIDAAVGDEIEADLDKDMEKMLIGAGAIRKLPAKTSSSKSKSASSAKEKS